MSKTKYDFSGYVTRNDLRCSDGRTIRKNAFKDCDGKVVPLVWQHDHNDPSNVLGHMMLENRNDGVYGYGKFNDTERGLDAKMLVDHGDITGLSIYANQLKQQGGDVLHGMIREVSLVLAGANPGAYIDTLAIEHSEASEEFDEAIIYTGEELELAHADADAESKPDAGEPKKEEKKVADQNGKEKTVKDVFDTLTEEQKTVVYALVGQAIEDAKKEKNKENDDMKHNVFDNDEIENGTALSHEEMMAIFSDAKRLGSLKEAVLQHGEILQHDDQDYGITNIDFLFPDARNVSNTPEFIKRDMDWVQKVMRGVHHTPFSRIKSIFADITEDEARAKGYLKGHQKKEEVFGLLKRPTTPQTIYKKQKLDRDDVIDITDFDVVAWLKSEMRLMLDEEIARAILVGDGRSDASDDKIDPIHIRPIWTDSTSAYTVNQTLTFTNAMTVDQKAKAFIRASVKGRKDYKGTGNPILFTTEDLLTDMLLMEDVNGRVIYDTEDKLATALRVREIVTVPVMEGLTREVSGTTRTLLGIIVNLADYTVGADKGGAVNMFDDFDIDYNQQKYLIETRCSGALVKPFSAIIIESVQGE